MAELLHKYWRGESLRMTLYIDENTEYVSYMNSTDRERFINNINFSKSEGNNAVNPLGVASSGSVSIVLFDINDDLSPASLTSPYAGKIVTGLKIKLEITYDSGNTWLPFGIYYTTSISGGYSDGMYTTISIQAEDRLNILGNTLVPELDVYANVEIGEIIDSLFLALGFTTSEYYVDPKLNTHFLWGILPNTKVRDFINSACQRMFARVVIDNEGVIRWVPALELPTDYNSLTVSANDLSSLKNNNANNINYSKVNVRYYVYGEEEDVTVYSSKNLSFAVGHNVVNNIKFNNEVLCIKNVDIRYKSELGLGKVTNVEYVAYQSGMVIECDVEGSSIYGLNITVDGVVVSQLTSIASVNIDNSNRIGLTEYTFDVKSRMTEAEALALCNQLVEYIKTLQNTITVNNTVLTSELTIGDLIVIEGTDTMYDGTYKIIKQSLTFSETYKNNMTLLRVSTASEVPK